VNLRRNASTRAWAIVEGSFVLSVEPVHNGGLGGFVGLSTTTTTLTDR
jgi:hypothetical protein